MKKIFFLPIIGLLLLVFFTALMPPINSSSGNSDTNIGLIDLNDGESTYAGHNGQFLKVVGNGWTFADVNASGSDTNASCTITVGSSGADYNDIPDAVDYLNGLGIGGRICIGPGTFQLTRVIDVQTSGIQIIGSGTSTNIRTNPLVVTSVFQNSTGSQISYFVLKDVAIAASSNLGNGLAINGNGFVLSRFENIYINGYNKGIDFNKSNTFYDQIENVRISVSGIGSFGIRFNDGANEHSVYRTRIITDGNGTGVIVNTHGISLYETNVESGSAIGIDVQSLGNDATIIAPYLESNIINLRLASGVYGFSLFGGSIQSGTTANIQDLGADKPVMTGMKLGFASATSVFGDINAQDTNVENLNLDKNITEGNDKNHYIGRLGNTDIFYSGISFIANVIGGSAIGMPGNTWAFCVFSGGACSGSGIWFEATNPRGIEYFFANALGFFVGGGSANTLGSFWIQPRTSNPTVGAGATWSGAMYVKSTDLNRLVINTGTKASPTYFEVGSNLTDDLEESGNAHIGGILTVDTNIIGETRVLTSAVGTSCTTMCGSMITGGTWTCAEAVSTAGAASTCGQTLIADNCVCKSS